MIIRVANKTDVADLLNLIEEMVIYHEKIDKYYKNFSQYKGLEEEVESWISNKDMIVLVAEEYDNLIGYTQVSVETAPTYASIKRIGVVYDVFISEKYRRKNIAKDLFDQALDWLKSKKIKYIELSVDSRNTAGVKYWESLGFFPYKFRMRMDL